MYARRTRCSGRSGSSGSSSSSSSSGGGSSGGGGSSSDLLNGIVEKVRSSEEGVRSKA